jgi:hypothetical protein
MTSIKHTSHAVARLLSVVTLAVLSFNWADTASAADVSATVSKSAVQVAEPFTLELTVQVPAGTRVVFPTMADRLGEFDVIDSQDLFDIPDAVASDLRNWTRRLTLESIVTGDLEIPPIEIQVSDQDGSRATVSHPLPVRVISVLEDRSDPTQFRDIQSVVDVEVPEAASPARLWWAIGGVSGIACAFALAMLIRRGKQWLTPKQWALQQLDQLGETVKAEPADTQSVSVELANIIRDYLQLQFGFPEAGRTLQELIDLVESRGAAKQEVIKSLRALSSVADKAKFAALDLSPAGLNSLVAGSRQIVEQLADDAETQAAAAKPTEAL